MLEGNAKPIIFRAPSVLPLLALNHFRSKNLKSYLAIDYLGLVGGKKLIMQKIKQ
jgi:hypothetical protein